MKKLILAIAFLGFVGIGVLGLQSVTASSINIEFAKFDKDPKKEGDKKAAETKNAKAESKSEASCADMKASSNCGDKAASSCCSKEASTKESPDKK